MKKPFFIISLLLVVFLVSFTIEAGKIQIVKVLAVKIWKASSNLWSQNIDILKIAYKNEVLESSAENLVKDNFLGTTVIALKSLTKKQKLDIAQNGISYISDASISSSESSAKEDERERSNTSLTVNNETSSISQKNTQPQPLKRSETKKLPIKLKTTDKTASSLNKYKPSSKSVSKLKNHSPFKVKVIDKDNGALLTSSDIKIWNIKPKYNSKSKGHNLKSKIMEYPFRSYISNFFYHFFCGN